MAWVSFCISTYKRPEFLRKQLTSLLQQTFADFEIVISDNDPEASARAVASSFEDGRIKYHHNAENFGMIKSFNKSIDRASTDYIVMVTDDDPIETTFLSVMSDLWQRYPGHSLYGGFERKGKPAMHVELLANEDFIAEILDKKRTPNLLWSSVVMEKDSVLRIGKIPDYGSPHLADHVLMALTGSKKGAVIINKMYSTLTSHDSNFSKLNLEYYYVACLGFYETMTNAINTKGLSEKSKIAVMRHLHQWFIPNVFNLKKYYTVTKPDKDKIAIIEDFSRKMLSLDFMRSIKTQYFLKQKIFKVKLLLNVLK